VRCLKSQMQSASPASFSASYANNCSAHPNPLVLAGPPGACRTHLKSTTYKAHRLRVKKGLVPTRQQYWAAAAALGSSRHQQHRPDRRQQQQHELPTSGDATKRSAAHLAGDASPALKDELR